MKLPPGQTAIRGFPRFGTHLHHPPPAVPAAPTLEITGAIAEPLVLPLGSTPELCRAASVSRLPLRGRVVGNRAALGGRPVRHAPSR